MRFYERHGCILFWNPQDVTDANLRSDTPDAEALFIQPGEISSCEGVEGQYVVQHGHLQAYESYPGHEGVDAVFEVLKRTPAGYFSVAAIEQCVKMRWQIMEACDEGEFLFRRYESAD